MSKLPRVSGDDLVRAFQKRGFTVRRQQGSHIIMRRDDPFDQTCSHVPELIEERTKDVESP
jgi:predicted RNA binding protein YcfA (HicA-like mRNA interferase family)